MEKFKSGFVSIIGNPNVGKSSFLNLVIGHKVSIVSQKVQTTRNVVRGIKTTDDYQMIFLDTPGIHKSKNKLNKFMNNQISSSLDGVDVILYLFDGEIGIRNKEVENIE